MVILQSDLSEVRINPFGAELSSFVYLPSGTECIWQAHAEWPRHAPVLFPFVGRLKDFTYHWEGSAYTIEQHGFARDLTFQVVDQKKDSVVFDLLPNAYTRLRYPFDFRLHIRYALFQTVLTMEFEIENRGNSTMPFSFGAHPAFKVSDIESAQIVFERDADPLSWELRDNFLTGNRNRVTDGNGSILLTRNTFNRDALIFKELDSKWVKLVSPSDGYEIKVQFDGWPYLGIWSKPSAGFVCIEPWQGLADNWNASGNLSEKEGILLLDPGAIYRKSFTMEFLSL